MINTSIQRIKKIEMHKKPHKVVSSYATHIIITLESGREFELSLFADDKDNLEIIKVEGY